MKKVNWYTVFITTLMILEIFSIYLTFRSFSNREIEIENLINIDDSYFAVMLQQEDGTYLKSESEDFPTDMVYNTEKSGCTDGLGNGLENALTYENNVAKVKTKTSTYCYLYFDRPVVSVTINEVNGNGTQTKEVNRGDNATFTGTPKSGYVITGATISCTNDQSGTIASDGTITISNVTSTTTCTVTYKPGSYTLTVTVKNSYGTASPASQTVSGGSSATSTITAKSGYTTSGATVSCVGSTGTISNGKVIVSNMTTNTTCTVTLKALTYTVTYKLVSSSYASLSRTSQTVNPGSSSTVTVTPKTGYSMTGATVSCTNSQSASISSKTVTVSNVKNNTTCTIYVNKIYTKWFDTLDYNDEYTRNHELYDSIYSISGLVTSSIDISAYVYNSSKSASTVNCDYSVSGTTLNIECSKIRGTAYDEEVIGYYYECDCPDGGDYNSCDEDDYDKGYVYCRGDDEEIVGYVTCEKEDGSVFAGSGSSDLDDDYCADEFGDAYYRNYDDYYYDVYGEEFDDHDEACEYLDDEGGIDDGEEVEIDVVSYCSMDRYKGDVWEEEETESLYRYEVAVEYIASP